MKSDETPAIPSDHETATPLTDALMIFPMNDGAIKMLEHARDLERALSAAKLEAEELKKFLERERMKYTEELRHSGTLGLTIKRLQAELAAARPNVAATDKEEGSP